MIPSDSIGGIAELRLGDIKVLSVDHQSLEESDLEAFQLYCHRIAA